MSAISIKDRIAAKRGGIADGRSKGQRLYKWKAGKTVFRIVPAKDGGDWDRRYGMTWIKSFDGQQKLTIGDRDITYGEPDPIKSMIFNAMKQAPTEEIRKHFLDMLAKTRYVFQVLIISVNGNPDPDAPADTPVLVDMSEAQFDLVLAQFQIYLDMDESYDLASPDRGHLFTCEKTGTGLDTKYSIFATPQVYPISKEVIDKSIDLDAWLKGEFEGREEKARELLSKTGAAAGLTIDTNVSALVSGGTPAAQLTGPTGSGNAAPAQVVTQTVTPSTPTGMSEAAVTTVIDAEIEEIPAETVTAPETVTPVLTPATGVSDMDEIDDILANL